MVWEVWVCNILEVADAAEVIVNGYAFTKAGESDRKLTESGWAKFFVKKDGETTIENAGQLTDKEIRMIREFIKDNYKEMYMKWSQKSDNGFYGE